jgi:hypothetical protein
MQMAVWPAAGCNIEGMAANRELNVIRIGDNEFLLTATNGSEIHLARKARRDETGRGAVPGWYFEPGPASARQRWEDYDVAALAESLWAEITLCGRRWVAMAGGGARRATGFDDEIFGPSCRRCLSIMDKLFPEPEPAGWLALVVQVTTDTVAEHGYAEMRNVPGDQQALLRKRVRSAVRQRTGQGIRTLVLESTVMFVCEPIHQLHAADRARQAAAAMSGLFTGEPSVPMPTPWCLSWDTWANP